MQIEWVRCLTYEEARNYRHCIYLHEWDGKPFYWGKVQNSFFGGHMRTTNGYRASGRYNVGYRHWIEGCLRHGAELYLGKLPLNGVYTIDQVENYLIMAYPSEMNSKCTKTITPLDLTHVGDVPPILLAI